MAFFKNILSRLAAAGSGGAEPAAAVDGPPVPTVRLAVFGKHPAWDDHIADVGLDTDRLVAVKRAFYLQGVGANLDAGTWDKLEPAQRVDRFDHLFLWRTGSSLVLGRAVASKDGKGRGRFPLVACAQCTGVPAARVAADVAPLLDDALARCGRTTSRDEVLAILADVAARLQAVATAAPAVAPGAPPFTMADLIASPELGEGGAKLSSVLFQVEREMKPFAPAPTSGRPAPARQAPPAAVHLRVPACAPSPADAARLWVEVLATRLDPSASILAVVAVGQGWVDLIVGDPRPADFYCLLASRAMLPFTTDIPFSMDPSIIVRARRWAADLAASAPASKPAPVPATAPPSPEAIADAT